MRNGTLLAEDSPSELLKLYGCVSLEDVFLLLSRKQGRNSQDVVADENDGTIEVSHQRHQQQPPPHQDNNRRANIQVKYIFLIEDFGPELFISRFINNASVIFSSVKAGNNLKLTFLIVKYNL